MKVVWLGIAAAFGCLVIASLSHFLYVRHKYPPGPRVGKVSGISTGFAELKSLAVWMVSLEVVGFAIALMAAMIDAFS